MGTGDESAHPDRGRAGDPTAMRRASDRLETAVLAMLVIAFLPAPLLSASTAPGASVRDVRLYAPTALAASMKTLCRAMATRLSCCEGGPR